MLNKDITSEHIHLIGNGWHKPEYKDGMLFRRMKHKAALSVNNPYGSKEIYLFLYLRSPFGKGMYKVSVYQKDNLLMVIKLTTSWRLYTVCLKKVSGFEKIEIQLTRNVVFPFVKYIYNFRGLGIMVNRIEISDRIQNFQNLYEIAIKSVNGKVDSGNGDKNIALQKLTATWFLTWKCNYRCPYCWQEIGRKFYRVSSLNWKPAKQWAEAWNRIKPSELDISGGEPGLYPELIELMESLDSSIEILLTSHIGKPFNAEKFVERLKPASRGGNIKKLCLSFHPTQVDMENFISNAVLLKKAGFNIQVNFVMYPKQMWKVDEYQKRLRAYGLEMHIEPYVMPSRVEGGRPFILNQREMAWIKKWISKTASPENAERCGRQQFIPGRLKESDAAAKKEWGVNRHPVLCDAGIFRLAVDETGEVYPCMTALTRGIIFGKNAMPYYRPVGNILSEDFKLSKEPVLCWEAYRCSGCDYDWLNDFWKYPDIPEANRLKPPE